MLEVLLPLPSDLWALNPALAQAPLQGWWLLDFLVAAGEAALQGTATPSLLPTRPGWVNPYQMGSAVPSGVTSCGS